MTILDIRDWRQKGGELHQKIEDAVYDTQRGILRPLPSELWMTQDQFNDLSLLAHMPYLHQSTERIYTTKRNAMEVKVKDA